MNYWKWNNIHSLYWEEPAIDIYYYLYKWHHKRGTKKLLDLGAGLGRHSILFADHGFDVTAFDSSAEGLRMIDDKGNLNIKSVFGDMLNLTFDNEQFDFIVAYNSIYHTNKVGLKKLVKELHRILNITGEMYLTILSKSDPYYIDNKEKINPDGSVFKREEDGQLLPHIFMDKEEIEYLFAKFLIVNIRHIETYHNDKNRYHYHVYLKKENCNKV